MSRCTCEDDTGFVGPCHGDQDQLFDGPFCDGCGDPALAGADHCLPCLIDACEEWGCGAYFAHVGRGGETVPLDCAFCGEPMRGEAGTAHETCRSRFRNSLAYQAAALAARSASAGAVS